jgi:ribose transport system substrate-binding protein
MPVEETQQSRRGLLKQLTAGSSLGLGALLAGCRGAGRTRDDGNDRRRLRAAFSSDGLQGSWNRRGKECAELWGELLDVDVNWFDGKFDGRVQRETIESIVEDDWDFCAFQAHEMGILEEAVRQLKRREIPVIAMDTLIVERQLLREVGVWIYIAPDHVDMAEKSTRYMMEKVGGEGKVLHIGGQRGHSGSRDREKGFHNVLEDYPLIELVGGGVQWCDWNTTKAREVFEFFLEDSEEPIAGTFFHNDDMALACVSALEGTRHENMVITAVDGQEEGLRGIREGRLAATSVNPTCMIHGWSLILGQFIVRNGEAVEEVPLEITCPSPLVALETGNLEAMFYLSNPKHCLV